VSCNGSPLSVWLLVVQQISPCLGCSALQIKQPKKTLSNKEKKKKDRLKAARRKAGETVSDSEEEW